MSLAAMKLKTVDNLLEQISAAQHKIHLELIDGTVVEKTSPSYEHGKSQSALIASIYGNFKKKPQGDGSGGWWIASEVLIRYEQHQAFQHDLVGWRRTRVQNEPSGKIVELVPDWACEILSTNRARDLVTKKWVMQKNRVSYYWIVDLERQVLSVLHWSEKGYVETQDVSPGMRARLAPFDAVEFDIALLFGADPDDSPT